ncbi:SDR family oxidoreductase [Nocardia camponoti]|uniref:Thioester reductase (TE) domain-containing protein n=1 Tax=Nocardia camponoti TaxID=1616106 RepID=A0A917Q8T7_9NOCA|nr:SDR family oxidoreductase [Nocardia camponoti]GGK32855.1 hypothetical protein GCM10011591_00680 [Nocardia camponoti]
MTVERHALVFGASGFIGRHLIVALDRAGVRVTAATRSADSFARLCVWLSDHGVRAEPEQMLVDFTAPQLGDPAQFRSVTEVYNCAGAFQFGMTNETARAGNVDSVRAIVRFVAELDQVARTVFVSGYRVGGQEPAARGWSAEQARATYRRLGAYEASKAEADAVFQGLATEAGLAWSIINPCTVIGSSVTGETDQYVGLAETIAQLAHGKLPAVPGNDHTFVPIVAVDYLADFMVLLPTDPSSAGMSYWVLDDNTPTLPTLIALAAERLGVRAPRFRVSPILLRLLPRALTKADPETLSFLATERYPTASANELAARHGLVMPDTTRTITRWVDHLAGREFGGRPAAATRTLTQ